MKMELRHLRYFLAVGEQLNFTRAARLLNISQPPLTQQIRRLESELGVMLIDRSSYRIQLTEAGKVFLPEARRILRDVQQATSVARRAAAGMTGQVRVGFTESSSFNPLVTSSVSRFRSLHSDVEVSLEEQPSTVLAASLRDNRIDAAFLRPPLAEGEKLVFQMLELEEMLVAVPRSSALARRKVVDLPELKSQPFIL